MNYDWIDYKDGIRRRFPEEVLGYSIWREYAESLESPRALDQFLSALAQERLSVRPLGQFIPAVTRVFVSHKKQDRDAALRTAWIINQTGHHFWLDVLDPTLASGRLNPFQIAAVIEIALLNCTHVIALITPASRTSKWIPYEFGRAKEPTPWALNAASWLHPNTRHVLPEYLSLSPCLRTQQGIEAWLQPHMPPIAWHGQAPPPPP